MQEISKREAEISLRAYYLWEAEGRPEGKDFEYWLRAQAELAASEAEKLKPTRNRTSKTTKKASGTQGKAKK